MFEEKTISRKQIYKGRIIDLYDYTVELPNKRLAKREIVEHKGAVSVIAITDKKQIVLVKQYRKPTEQVMLEVPAGVPNAGEVPEQTAVRELQEETGYIAAKTKILLSAYVSPGYSTEFMTFVLAQDLKLTEKKPDEDEITEAVVVDFTDPMEMISSLDIKDNKTIIGLFLAAEVLK